MMSCRRELNKSVLSGSLCSGLRSRWKRECERTLLQLYVWFFVDVFSWGLTFAAVSVSMFFLSIGVTHSGRCHSVVPCRSCRNMKKGGLSWSSLVRSLLGQWTGWRLAWVVVA